MKLTAIWMIFLLLFYVFFLLFKPGLSVNIIFVIVTSNFSDFNFPAPSTTFLAISFGGTFEIILSVPT